MPRLRKEIIRNTDYEFHIVGGHRLGLRDLYHALLRVPWWAVLVTIAGSYLALNALFAVAYAMAGGIQGARPGSFVDAFFFSVQTMGTIGYGVMAPVTNLANAIVVVESVVGLVVVALATGFVFARFSQTRGRVMFSRRLALSPIDGVPTVQVRLGNERRGQIVDVHFRMSLVLKVTTAEGRTIYRSSDLRLVRERANALARSWMILHPIDDASPLRGETPDSLKAKEAEITVAVAGIDDTSLQLVHAQKIWRDHDVVWGARLADVLSEMPDGNLLLDLRRFHDLEPTAPSADFPYGEAGIR